MVKYNLKGLRAKRGITQEQMAEVLEITSSTYNRKENGLREFTIEEAKKISEFFGESIEEIFFAN